MEITRIEFSNYKSVKKPVTVNFDNDMPMVLIGKNASGKTNILEALEIIACANANIFYNSQVKENFQYKIDIELSEQDFEKFFPDTEYNKSKCRLSVSNGENMKADRIKSDYIVPLLRKEIEDISKLTKNLKKAFEKYKKQLERIANKEMDAYPVSCFELHNWKGGTTNYKRLEFKIDFILKQTENLIKELSKRFLNEEKSTLTFIDNNYHMTYFPDLDVLPFELEFLKPDLASFERKFITIDEAAIKREINKINKATRDSLEKIKEYLGEIDKRKNFLQSNLEPSGFSAYSGNEKKYYQFLLEIRNLMGKKCLFLKNESNSVIFYEQTNEHERYYQSNSGNPIFETYRRKICNKNAQEPLLESGNNSEASFSEDELKEFEEYLNKNLPDFENGMLEKVSIEKSGEKSIAIFMHEKSGEKIDLNNTSAGRRWYFTYYFMKNSLEEGDLFIIDEPAAMLHPLAQKEVLEELAELTKQGIKVVYSTHSPYLIPEKWQSVNVVSMSESSTEIFNVTAEKELFSRMREISGNDIFNFNKIYEIYNNYDKDKLRENCYNAIAEYFGTENPEKLGEKAENEWFISKYTIKSWITKNKNKKRTPNLENILLIADKTGKNIMELLT